MSPSPVLPGLAQQALQPILNTPRSFCGLQPATLHAAVGIPLPPGLESLVPACPSNLCFLPLSRPQETPRKDWRLGHGAQAEPEEWGAGVISSQGLTLSVSKMGPVTCLTVCHTWALIPVLGRRGREVVTVLVQEMTWEVPMAQGPAWEWSIPQSLSGQELWPS